MTFTYEYEPNSNETIITNATGYGKAIIPDKVVAINKKAFQNNHNLTSLIFSDNSECEKIYNTAFCSCSQLESIKFPQILKSLTIDYGVFQSCTKLKSVIFPEKMESEKMSIGVNAFYNCSQLVNIIFPENLEKLSIGNSAFQTYSLSSVTFPRSLKSLSIGNLGFVHCSLTNITFPQGLIILTIGDGTFNSCTKLISVKIPDSLESLTIGNQAFYGCSQLMSVTFPDSLAIGDKAFYDCPKLKTVILPFISTNSFDSSTQIFIVTQEDRQAEKDRIKQLEKDKEENEKRKWSYNTLLDRIHEMNIVKDFITWVNSTIENPFSRICWDGFIHSIQDRPIINVRLLDNKYDDIVSNLLHHLNRIEPDYKYETEYIETILKMYIINYESRLEFIRERREKKHLHQETIKQQIELALEQKRIQFQQEKENKEIKMKENRERREKEAELELLEKEAIELALAKIEKDKLNIKLQEDELEKTKEKEIQIALDKVQNNASNEFVILTRIDRKTNDLKQDLRELHHLVGDARDEILEVVSRGGI